MTPHRSNEPALKAWRVAAKLTQQAAADKIGVSQQAYSRYEKGREPEPAVARRIIHVARGAVTWDDLYGRVAQSKKRRAA